MSWGALDFRGGRVRTRRAGLLHHRPGDDSTSMNYVIVLPLVMHAFNGFCGFRWESYRWWWAVGRPVHRPGTIAPILTR